MKHAETFLSAHTDPDAEMSLGRGNTVEHVQCIRIEALVASNIADALEGGITGGIPAAHARDLCLDAIRELVNIAGCANSVGRELKRSNPAFPKILPAMAVPALAIELPFACFSIHLKGESKIAYVRASILVLSRAYAIEDLFCVTHSGIF